MGHVTWCSKADSQITSNYYRVKPHYSHMLFPCYYLVVTMGNYIIYKWAIFPCYFYIGKNITLMELSPMISASRAGCTYRSPRFLDRRMESPVGSISLNTGWCPPSISWFINPINYSYIYHKPKLSHLYLNLAILGAPSCNVNPELINHGWLIRGYSSNSHDMSWFDT